MVARENIGLLVRYYKDGWYTGKLVKIEKNLAVIQTLVAGQRNKKVPIRDVEVYKP